jgi:hypothetical protein
LEEARRDRVRARFTRACGYCGVREEHAGATLTVDHHQPRVRGGSDENANLVYACPRCNEHKGTYWHEEDPPHVRLLHPGRDDLDVHLREEESGELRGITADGAFFIARLKLNRAPLVAYRLHLRDNQRLRREIEALRERTAALEQRMDELNAALDEEADEIEGDG